MKQLLIFAALALSVPVWASESDPFFPKPDYFRKHFAKPQLHVELQPPVRLGDFVADGKFELTLKNYLDLVLANNNDVTVLRLQIEPFRNQVQRSFGIFDPLLLGAYSSTRQQTPSSSTLSGAKNVNQLQQPLQLQYSQTLQTGTQYNVLYNASKVSTNNSFATFNPVLTSNLAFNVAQPLLRGRGGYIARLPITIARSRLRANEFGFQDQVLQLVTNAENAYWDVVGARENLRVQEKSLDLADLSLKRSKRELELGAISPLEIFQPEAVYANAELGLTQARYRLGQTEDALRRQMGADLDAAFRSLPIVLTESVTPPAGNSKIDPEEEVAKALRLRPDVKAAAQFVDTDDLAIRQANDNLRPALSLTGTYAGFGIGGNSLSSTPGVAGVPGGLGDALGQMFGFSYPTYGFGLVLQLPIRDHRASADLADAMVNKKLDLVRVKLAEQNTRLQVLTAVNLVESSKASVELAKVARDLAQKRVDADQKRYELGTTTIFFVLASQGDLVQAESNLVTQIINYHRNILNLYQRTGELLDERGITVQ